MEELGKESNTIVQYQVLEREITQKGFTDKIRPLTVLFFFSKGLLNFMSLTKIYMWLNPFYTSLAG